MSSPTVEPTADRLHGRSAGPGDHGFTLIEMLVVVMILGVLGTVVVMSLGGLSTEAADTGCHADRHQLETAVEAFVAQTGVHQVAATGIDHDRFERSLVEDGFLRSPSTSHDLDDQGVVIPEENSQC